MIDCVKILGDMASADACVSVTSSMLSAKIQAKATYVLAASTLIAGLAALGGGWFVLRNGAKDRDDRRKLEIRASNLLLRQYAAVHSAELKALWQFLDEHGVIGTLRRHAEEKRVMDFAPGSAWLPFYQTNPSSIGMFGSDIASRAAFTLTRTLNEIGRLSWLHHWQAPNDDSRSRQQTMSADTLTTLRMEASQLTALLDAVYSVTNPSRPGEDVA